MTDTVNLPELPPHDETVECGSGDVRVWEERSMRAYATAAVLAERERCASKAAEMDCAYRCRVGAEVASAIRGTPHDSQGDGE